jgi:TM2 domain-containing membrane protein YozV
MIGGQTMPKNKWIAFFLCLFLGVLGIHKFYEGRVLLGILYLFTVGLVGIGVIIDLIVLFFKPNPYYP